MEHTEASKIQQLADRNANIDALVSELHVAQVELSFKDFYEDCESFKPQQQERNEGPG